MDERHHDDHGQPLFLDEPPDLPRRAQPEAGDTDALFADEETAFPPGSRAPAAVLGHGFRLPDSWSITGRPDGPAATALRGALMVVLVLAAVAFGFLAAHVLLN